MPKHYVTNCVQSTERAITDMVDNSRDITRRTFLKHVHREDLARIAEEMGYAKHPRQGLTLAADWSISYHKSQYRGRPCVYLCWSAIEYIFC